VSFNLLLELGDRRGEELSQGFQVKSSLNSHYLETGKKRWSISAKSRGQIANQYMNSSFKI